MEINYAILIATMKIYLDTCSLNRPFDDQSQERIRLETESVMIILARLSRKEWIWLGSQALKIEIDRAPDADQRSRLHRITGYVGQVVAIGQKELNRASELEKLGLAVLTQFIWLAPRAAEQTYFYQPTTVCSNAQSDMQRKFT